jgi:hypothetical protein
MVEYVKRSVYEINPFLVLRGLEVELFEPLFIFLLDGGRKRFHRHEPLQLVRRAVILGSDILYPIV